MLDDLNLSGWMRERTLFGSFEHVGRHRSDARRTDSQHYKIKWNISGAERMCRSEEHELVKSVELVMETRIVSLRWPFLAIRSDAAQNLKIA